MQKSKRGSTKERRLVDRYGPWALVTGASDGIGRAIAKHLAGAGLNLVLAARRREVLDALAAELASAHGVDVRAVAVDLSTPAGMETLAQQTDALDVGLFVAAAGFGTSGEFVTSEIANELEMLEVNCRAVVAASHHFARRFVARGRGGLVFLSSLVAFQGVPRAANYAATKAFIQSFAEGLGHELAPRGVDVLATAPGPVRSGFGSRAAMTMGFAQTPDAVARATLRALGRRRTVRPGLLAKLLELSLKMLPRWGRVRMMGLIMAGMTKGHA
ncbi:MAG TPA: SDR family NAD(P)-dependent oxidoreductase [Polyangia bacterium]|nr:SDR family NAD(P)-dependent oxidoreductase [Polyangia bacterium]